MMTGATPMLQNRLRQGPEVRYGVQAAGVRERDSGRGRGLRVDGKDAALSLLHCSLLTRPPAAASRSRPVRPAVVNVVTPYAAAAVPQGPMMRCHRTHDKLSDCKLRAAHPENRVPGATAGPAALTGGHCRPAPRAPRASTTGPTTTARCASSRPARKCAPRPEATSYSTSTTC